MEKLVPNPFLKSQIVKLRIYLDQQSEMLYSLFLLHVHVKDNQNMKVRCWPLACTSESFLKKTKKSKSSLPASFSVSFLKRIFLALYSINWPNFIAWLPLLREILCNIICAVMIYFPVYDVINFEITLAFLSSNHFPTWPKSQ